MDSSAPPPKKKTRWWIVILVVLGIGVLILVVAVGGMVWWFSANKDRLAAMGKEAEEQSTARLKLLLQRGWARRAGGDLARSLEDLTEMIAHAVQTGNLRAEVNGLVDLSRFCLYVDRRQCLPLAEQALAKSRVLDDSAFGALVQGNAANHFAAQLNQLGFPSSFNLAPLGVNGSVNISDDFDARTTFELGLPACQVC